MRKVFVDTAAWIALINVDDVFHEQAKRVKQILFYCKWLMLWFRRKFALNRPGSNPQLNDTQTTLTPIENNYGFS